MIWKVLVVHDRKYHLFLTPGEGREKVVGAWKRVQKSKINVTEYFFFRTGHHGVARKLLPLTLESFKLNESSRNSQTSMDVRVQGT